jgi:hypothetical protein
VRLTTKGGRYTNTYPPPKSIRKPSYEGIQQNWHELNNTGILRGFYIPDCETMFDDRGAQLDEGNPDHAREEADDEVPPEEIWHGVDVFHFDGFVGTDVGFCGGGGGVCDCRVREMRVFRMGVFGMGVSGMGSGVGPFGGGRFGE